MKKVLLLAVTCLITQLCQIQAQSLDIVRDFGETMSRWTKNYNINDITHIERLCDQGLRISDDVSDEIILHYKMKTSSVMLHTYLSWFDVVNEGKTSLHFSDYEHLNKEKLKCTSKYAKEKAKDESREYLTCKIMVCGSHSYEESVLICVRNNLIFGITKLKKKGKRIILK